MEWNPEDYATHSQAQLEWARELITRLDLSGDESVLDVGSGNGRVSSELASAVPRGRVLGIDSSPAFVDYARRRYPPDQHLNLAFAMMDARAMVLTETFDVVFSNAALHWVDDHPSFLSGAARILKPTGTLIVSCGGAGNADGIVNAIESTARKAAWLGYFRDFVFPYFFYSTTDYGPWLRNAGLRPTRLELVEKDMIHAGRDGLEGWIRTTWMPYTHRVPDEFRKRFLTETVDAYLDAYPLDEAGNSHVRMVRLEVEAHPVSGPVKPNPAVPTMR